MCYLHTCGLRSASVAADSGRGVQQAHIYIYMCIYIYIYMYYYIPNRSITLSVAES